MTLAWHQTLKHNRCVCKAKNDLFANFLGRVEMNALHKLSLYLFVNSRMWRPEQISSNARSPEVLRKLKVLYSMAPSWVWTFKRTSVLLWTGCKVNFGSSPEEPEASFLARANLEYVIFSTFELTHLRNLVRAGFSACVWSPLCSSLTLITLLQML